MFPNYPHSDGSRPCSKSLFPNLPFVRLRGKVIRAKNTSRLQQWGGGGRLCVGFILERDQFFHIKSGWVLGPNREMRAWKLCFARCRVSASRKKRLDRETMTGMIA